MTRTTTSRYDVAEHLRTPEEMAAYLEASLEEANGDAAFIAKALGDIARAKGMSDEFRSYLAECSSEDEAISTEEANQIKLAQNEIRENKVVSFDEIKQSHGL